MNGYKLTSTYTLFTFTDNAVCGDAQRMLQNLNIIHFSDFIFARKLTKDDLDSQYQLRQLKENFRIAIF